MNAKRILIADDEPLYCKTTGELLRKAGFDCLCVSDANEAIKVMEEQHFDLLLSDLNMPGNFKLELLQTHNQQRPTIPVIVVTGAPSLPTAIESIRLGITDYLLKPVKFDNLLISVKTALDKAERRKNQRTGYQAVSPKSQSKDSNESRVAPRLLGQSQPMMELLEIIERVAHSDSNILITGESGTGKEEVALAIHQASQRHEGTFQVIDCTAIPESLFESTLFGHKKGAFTGAVSDQTGLLKNCHNGTAFLDELGELPLPLQAKLLRAVQQMMFTPVGSNMTETVNTRFVCATNRDLQLEIREGRFRQDLFYRLAVIHLQIPPLRDRGDDIILLAKHFLDVLQPNYQRVVSIDADAMQLLRNYRWPGNIRELRNIIERAIVLTKTSEITPSQLPHEIRFATTSFATAESQTAWDPPPEVDNAKDAITSREQAVRTAERKYLIDLLESVRGNISEAAKHAGLSRQGMHKLLRSHGVDAKQFRNENLRK